jgi:predicted kinase
MSDVDTLNNQIKIWQERHLHPLLPSMINSKILKNVIFLRGISGSGKSTICNYLSQALGSEKVVVCSADDYFIKNGVYKFEIEKAADAHNQCVNSMKIALQSPTIRYIIMDNTHTQLWHLANAENIANQHGAELFYIDVNVPDKAHFLLCLQRQRHNVPKEVLLYQWLNWEINPKSKNVPMFLSDEEAHTILTFKDNSD